MTVIRIPNQAEEAWLDLITAVNYTLGLYKNDVTDGLTDAQVNALTEASFLPATFAGYAAVNLTGGAWTTTPGNPSTATYAMQTFTRSSTGTTQQIYGWYLTTTAGGLLRAHGRFAPAGGIDITFINEEIRVTPTIPLRDTGDDA